MLPTRTADGVNTRWIRVKTRIGREKGEASGWGGGGGARQCVCQCACGFLCMRVSRV